MKLHKSFNKIMRIVLIVSLVLNAVWLIGRGTGYFSGRAGKSAAGVVEDGKGAGWGAVSPEAAREVAALLSAGDMVMLRDRLREAGVPDAVVRAFVAARISERSVTRQREIQRGIMEEAARRPYWVAAENRLSGSYSYSLEQWKELQNLDREADLEIRRVLGEDSVYRHGQDQYVFLPAEKRARLLQIERDYGDLHMEALLGMDAFRMPGDEEKLRLIGAEKLRDMQSLLTPEEREANDLRNSYTARFLKNDLRGVDVTEDEYKAIYALRKGVDERFPQGPDAVAAYGPGVDWEEVGRGRDEAQREVDARIKEALGAERYAQYELGQRGDYRSLQAAAKRFGLSEATVTQAYQARDAAVGEALRISNDTSLGADARSAAYTALAEQTAGQMRAALGDDAGNAYVDGALWWLKRLPKGGNVSVDARGNVRVGPGGGR